MSHADFCIACKSQSCHHILYDRHVNTNNRLYEDLIRRQMMGAQNMGMCSFEVNPPQPLPNKKLLLLRRQA